eukprot:195775-Chlamydomonas_euryale.AAC.3
MQIHHVLASWPSFTLPHKKPSQGRVLMLLRKNRAPCVVEFCCCCGVAYKALSAGCLMFSTPALLPRSDSEVPAPSPLDSAACVFAAPIFSNRAADYLQTPCSLKCSFASRAPLDVLRPAPHSVFCFSSYASSGRSIPQYRARPVAFPT